MRKIKFISSLVLLIICSLKPFAQNNKMAFEVQLDTDNHSLLIKQELTYYNASNDTLSVLYFHDWPNAFSDKNTDLGKRFIENYSKRFFFTKDKYRGHTTINNVVINHKSIDWKREKDTDDFFKIIPNTPLLPHSKTLIQLNYSVKIPSSKFTGYGVFKDSYNLRFWYITPVVYDGAWQLMHHLNMDDLYENPSDFDIDIQIPENYTLNSTLKVQKNNLKSYHLYGTNTSDIALVIAPVNHFKRFTTDHHLIVSNLSSIELDPMLKKDILNRQLAFLQEQIGESPQHKFLINKTAYFKDPLYGFNQLPDFLRPFSDTFEWDLRMFKTLTKQYINQSVQSHTRKNIWLKEGLQSYLMMNYVTQFYKETKLIGNASKIWGIRSYYFSKLDFNDRYYLTYQHFARKNRDQSLLTRADSLTNFNRLVLNKYKAGLGLIYLDDFLGNTIVKNAIKEAFTHSDSTFNQAFYHYILTHSDKDVSWFFNDFLVTDHKLDYALKKIYKKGDSLFAKIKNKKNSTWPIALYGIEKDTILSKQWFVGIDTTQIVSLKQNEATRWVLNYEQTIPEINNRNNWKNRKWKLFKRPFSIKWLDDADDPEHTQLFFKPSLNYNFYDGFMLASGFTNRNLLKKEFEYTFVPSYGFKSNSLTGSFKTIYWHYPRSSHINSYRLGLVGNYFHYKPNLAYKVLSPYAQVFFKKKDFRSVKASSLSLSYIMVDKEVNLQESIASDSDKYNVLYLKYIYSNPELINNFLFLTGLEFGTNFTKFSADIRFRKLTNSNRQFEARLFTGVFLSNKTTGDYFSYGVNRPNDYLFRYHYFGRSETSGFLSQQFITTDASIKSKMPVPFANQWVSSLNTSIGLWRWFELYNDVGFAKNKNQPVFFIHDKGVRLNFVHNILEVYFPVHSSNGWEITAPHYERRIRFVLASDLNQIVAFLKRGFM